MADGRPAADRPRLLRGWRGAAAAGAAVLLAVGGAVLGPQLLGDPFQDDVEVAVTRADAFQPVTSYADGGFDSLGYRHDHQASFTFPLVNDDGRSVEVTAVDPLPGDHRLLELEHLEITDAHGFAVALPFRLEAGQEVRVHVTARFANCQYTHERAIHTFAHAAVSTRVAGVDQTREVRYERALVVRTPTIVDCPGRKLARSHRTPPPPAGR